MVHKFRPFYLLRGRSSTAQRTYTAHDFKEESVKPKTRVSWLRCAHRNKQCSASDRRSQNHHMAYTRTYPLNPLPHTCHDCMYSVIAARPFWQPKSLQQSTPIYSVTLKTNNASYCTDIAQPLYSCEKFGVKWECTGGGCSEANIVCIVQ